jgi:hypothetical protein
MNIMKICLRAKFRPWDCPDIKQECYHCTVAFGCRTTSKWISNNELWCGFSWLGMNSVINFQGFITSQVSTDCVPQGCLSDQRWRVCESDYSAVVQATRPCASAPPTTPPTICCVGGAVRSAPSHWLCVTYLSPAP